MLATMSGDLRVPDRHQNQQQHHHQQQKQKQKQQQQQRRYESATPRMPPLHAKPQNTRATTTLISNLKRGCRPQAPWLRWRSARGCRRRAAWAGTKAGGVDGCRSRGKTVKPESNGMRGEAQWGWGLRGRRSWGCLFDWCLPGA